MRSTPVLQGFFKLWRYSISLFSVCASASSHSPFPPESSHKCYFIDGSFDPAGGPCYSNVGASMCCYDGEKCDDESTLCLSDPNGPVGEHEDGVSIWRRSGVESVQLSNCSDTTFCPRTKESVNATCCDEHHGEVAIIGHARIAESVISSIRASSTSSFISSTTVSQTGVSISPTSSSAPTATSSPAPTSGLSQSAKIGTGVGIAIGTLAIALLVYIAVCLRKNSRRDSGKVDETPVQPEEKNATSEMRPLYELGAQEAPKELHTVYNAHEVEGRVGI
ncbi:MAG: hypothetical protein Q9219_005748 [cf. Caloplaca sp. 3 TL-2023]